MEYIEVRCPSRRKHTIRGITYDICGHLLGGIGIDQKNTLFRCDACGSFYDVSTDNNMIKFVLIVPERGEKIKFKKKRRLVDVE